MPTNSNNLNQTGKANSAGFSLPRPPLQSVAIGMADSSKLGTFLIEPQTGRLLAVDAKVVKNFNICPDNMQANTLRSLFPDVSEQEWISLLDQNDKQECRLTTLVRRSDGCKFLARLISLPITGVQEDLLLLTIEPVSNDPAKFSHRDALTGLPDRRELVDHFQRWRQANGGQPNPFALLFMDLDHFKQINDQHGHSVGDQALIVLAQRWLDCVREGDLVVRYGGDEFVVLLAGITNQAEIKPVIDRLTTVAMEPILAGNEQLRVGVSIGVAFSGSVPDSLEQLVVAADRDMYASKRDPSNQKPL